MRRLTGPLAALITLLSAARANSETLEANVPRPRRIWRMQGQLGPTGRATDGTSIVYLFEPARRVPLAVRVRDGQLIWTGGPDAQAQPPTAPNCGDGRRWLETTPAAVQKVAGGLLLSWYERRLTARRASDGRLLWAADEPCELVDASENHALLKCHSEPDLYPPSLRVIDVTSRTPVLEKPVGFLRAWLQSDVLVVHKNAYEVAGFALDRGHRNWATRLFPDDTWSMRYRDLWGVLEADGAVVAYEPSRIVALDPRTGKALWRQHRPAWHEHRRVRACGRRVFLFEMNRSRALDAATGAPRHRSGLPDDLMDSRVTCQGESVLFNQDPLALWWREGHPAVPLNLPAAAPTSFLVRDVLVLKAGAQQPWEQDEVAAYDLSELAQPLADLTPPEAIASIIHNGVSTRPSASDLWSRHDLGPALVPHLHRGDPAFLASLEYLASRPNDQALPALLDALAEVQAELRRAPRPPPRRAQGQPPSCEWRSRAALDEERTALLTALEPLDDPGVTRAMVEVLRDGVEAARQPTTELTGSWRDMIYAHLWRTGRATEAGVCPSPAPRRVPTLAPGPAGGPIGTEHPIWLDKASPEGRWTSVCQARVDSDGDGLVGRGDLFRPYLVVGSGAGYAADEVIAGDPTGRWVAVRRGACLELIDTVDGTAVTLPAADLRDPQPQDGYARSVAFDGQGRHMAYIRGGAQERAIVRSLPDSGEAEIDPGPGNLLQTWLDHDGASAIFKVAKGSLWDVAVIHDRNVGLPESCGSIPVSFGPAEIGYETQVVVMRVSPSSGGVAHESGRDVPPPPPPVPQGRVRVVDGPLGPLYPHLRSAERDDGMVLTAPGAKHGSLGELRSGPLRWAEPGQ